VLSAQYFHYIFWDLAQRESFFDWFMLLSVAVQLAALSPQSRPRARAALLTVSGALSFIPWFGKPTYALFALAQLLTLAVTETRDGTVETGERRGRFKAFVIGGALGSLTQVAYLVVYADIGAFLRIYFVDVPRLYRFIWPRTPLDALGLSSFGALAIVSSALMVGLIVDGQLPRRVLAVALVPLCGLASVIVQAKGFPYHFHPVSAGVYLQGLVLVLWLSEHLGRPAASDDAIAPQAVTRFLRIVPFAAATALSLSVFTALLNSPHLENDWILEKGVTAELRRTKDYLVYFRTTDFFPWELRETAAYLDEHTKPDDTVQLYGMDPYLLFLARRRSATPYIYAYDLDVDTALTGSTLPEGLHPTLAQSEKIRALRDDHERDFLSRAKVSRPAAFVFMDGSPLITNSDDAWLDFADHNPTSAPWVQENYKETAAFGGDNVWLRRDLAEGMDELSRVPDAERSP
jgi:hypothetical protein